MISAFVIIAFISLSDAQTYDLICQLKDPNAFDLSDTMNNQNILMPMTSSNLMHPNNQMMGQQLILQPSFNNEQKMMTINSPSLPVIDGDLEFIATIEDVQDTDSENGSNFQNIPSMRLKISANENQSNNPALSSISSSVNNIMPTLSHAVNSMSSNVPIGNESGDDKLNYIKSCVDSIQKTLANIYPQTMPTANKKFSSCSINYGSPSNVQYKLPIQNKMSFSGKNSFNCPIKMPPDAFDARLKAEQKQYFMQNQIPQQWLNYDSTKAACLNHQFNQNGNPGFKNSKQFASLMCQK